VAVTQEDLSSFNRFAAQRLASGGASSLAQLVAEWEERQEMNRGIRAALEDVEAGRTEPFFEEDDHYRRERGFPPYR